MLQPNNEDSRDLWELPKDDGSLHTQRPAFSSTHALQSSYFPTQNIPSFSNIIPAARNRSPPKGTSFNHYSFGASEGSSNGSFGDLSSHNSVPVPAPAPAPAPVACITAQKDFERYYRDPVQDRPHKFSTLQEKARKFYIPIKLNNSVYTRLKDKSLTLFLQ